MTDPKAPMRVGIAWQPEYQDCAGRWYIDKQATQYVRADLVRELVDAFYYAEEGGWDKECPCEVCEQTRATIAKAEEALK